MSVDMKSLLKIPRDQVERSRGAPAGDYHGHITKYEFSKRAKYNEDPDVKYDTIIFKVLLTEPAEDQDITGIDLKKISAGRYFQREMYLTNEDIKYLYDFVETFGHDTSGQGVDPFLPELIGAPAIITIDFKLKGDDSFNSLRAIRGA